VFDHQQPITGVPRTVVWASEYARARQWTQR
jgi:hypothetical protein